MSGRLLFPNPVSKPRPRKGIWHAFHEVKPQTDPFVKFQSNIVSSVEYSCPPGSVRSGRRVSDFLDEVPIFDLSGFLSSSALRLASMIDHGSDFKTHRSPVGSDLIVATAPHNLSADTDDLENSVVEFGACQSLYNGEIYGSLRKGGAVAFFSQNCLGLVAATFAFTFSTECLNSIVQPMLRDHYGFKPATLAASERLTTLPFAFCFFVGLLSDCYPIFGFRRKGYLIIGLSMTAVSFFLLAVVDRYIDTLEKGAPGAAFCTVIIALSTLASTGIVATHVCVQTRVLELSQREPLSTRGAITGTFLIFKCIVFIMTDVIVFYFSSTSTNRFVSLTVFGLVVTLSIPVVWKVWQEKYYSLSTPMKTRGRILWRIMQQKAVWSILTFLCFFTLFGGIAFGGPSMVISVWSGTSGDNVFQQQVLQYGAMLVAIVAWRYYFMNQSWRTFYGMAIVLLVIPRTIVAIFVTQGLIRDRYFFHLMTIFTSVAEGMGWLASMVPLTEIIQEGSEGAMVGLMLSLSFSVKAFVQTNAVGLLNGTNFYNIAQVALDTSKARMDVLLALLFNYGINALALFGLYFLPRQKLYTQQLRSFGGYTKCASSAIVTFAAALFLYSVIITVLALHPSTSCLTVAGGDGC
ncbi:hypothetical protein CCR75_007635 [Bremia lactucae]|uniref:Transmembrane protein n=1 Tax=Bremia lactucae TaxID=4779 RepID=A0A976IF53_BRELC|nr:hypothetical protein CCR75_007635 [Bremia lactucae]